MNREQIIARLRENEAALRMRGVAHAALFGSRARGDQRPESDTDIMIEFDPAARITVFDHAGLKDYIASLFDGLFRRQGYACFQEKISDLLCGTVEGENDFTKFTAEVF